MKYLPIFSFFFFILSCKSKREGQPEKNNEADTATATPASPSFNPETKLYVWRATPDYLKEKNPTLAQPALPVDSLIKGLNEYYPDVFLEKKKQSGDTLYTEIKDSEHLTQRMGSTGAEIYIADVVLNLATVAGIKYIKIDFQEGDHAGPGVWSAENFKAYKEKKP